MKKLISTLCFVLGIASANAVAHSDHGSIDAGKAIEVAQKSAKMLTFKSYGMSVGKIDASWNKVSIDEFELVESTHDGFLIKANNPANKQTLFFTVLKSGEVQAVETNSEFKKAHGHHH